MLTNREIASLIILAAVLAIGFFSATVRKSFRDVLHAFNGTIFGLLAVYTSYACVIIFIAWHFGWWRPSLLKDTLLVAGITGIGMVFSANRIKAGGVLVKKTARDTLGLTSFITFYVNLTSLSIIGELALQLVTTSVMLLSLAGKRQKPPPKHYSPGLSKGNRSKTKSDRSFSRFSPNRPADSHSVLRPRQRSTGRPPPVRDHTTRDHSARRRRLPLSFRV